MYKLISILTFLLSATSAQALEYNSIKRITYSQGLSENTVSSINQDSLGCIWIGTREGLNRYNGYSCKNYFASLDNSQGLSSSAIQKIFIDSYSQMWISTAKGVDCYLPETDSFRKLEIEINKQRINRVNDVYEQSGLKWLATTSFGLVGIEPQTEVVQYHSDSTESFSLICEKNESELWLATGNKLESFNSKSKKFGQAIFAPFKENIVGLTNYSGLLWLNTRDGLWIYNELESEFALFEDYIGKQGDEIDNLVARLNDILITRLVVQNEKLWISTDGNGIFTVDFKNGFHIENIEISSSENSLATNAIRYLYSDMDDNMWIGTVHNGVQLIPNQQKKFYELKHTSDNPNYPNGNFSNFQEDKNNSLWAATFDGLCLIDQQSMTIKKFVAKGTIINTISIDWEGDIFLGTYNKGLLLYNPASDKIKDFGTADVSFDGRSINALLTDFKGNLWVGTNVLYYFNKQEKKFNEVGINEIGSVICLLEDIRKNIWVGTINGLFFVSTENRINNGFSQANNNIQKISDTWCNCLFEDKKGNIWIGTNGEGLKRISVGNHELTHFAKHEKLASNVVHGIAGDKSGNIWFTTNNGLANLNTQTQEFQVYNYTDGLINNQYIDESVYLSSSGKMLCGGEKGIDYFYPEQIRKNLTPPKVIVEGYFVGDKPVIADDNVSTYQRRIDTNDTLTFRYNQSYFSFQFTGIEFSNPQKIRYAYKLEGFNPDWIYVNEPRTVTYGHIASGKYKFKVKAANSDGYWTEEVTKINIVVKPPLAKTPLAYFLYIVVILGIWYLTYRYLLERKLLQNKLLNESKERKRIEELNQFKLRVFTHISHEFRTPLTLIVSPVQELLKRFKNADENRADLETIQNNAQKLQVLVNEVLEVRKIESGAVKMNMSRLNMVMFVKSCCDSFFHWAQQKEITLVFSTDINELLVDIDQSLMEKVIYNLLSNAIKYTNEGGTIELLLGAQYDVYTIKVIDSGIGISESNQKKLFEMFYRVDEEGSKEEGSGIGLAMSKELVELHNGKISIESVLGEGSCFTVTLPMLEKNYSLITNPELHDVVKENGLEDKNKKKSCILLVDDNDELRNFLAKKLAEHFKITEAINGQEALRIAKEQQPGLILSDVMMPEMDGWELCVKIKSDIKVSHIPVVLLTALSDVENTIKGLDLGADAYLAKPFNLDHIISLIKATLANRSKLKKRFGEDGVDILELNVLTAIDKNFLNKIQITVETRISDPGFSVQILAGIMAMSRANLHIKLKALCDLAPSEFIMQIRLQEAIKLLRKREYRVSEIADMTGFSTASHFSRNFKKFYGGSPSEFLEGKIRISK